MSGGLVIVVATGALACSTVCGAAGLDAVTASQPSAGAQAASASQSPWIMVTSAQDLVGRTLRDPNGRESGRIDSVIVDLQSGDALFAVVGSAGSFDVGSDYVPVPFSELKLTPDRNVMDVTVAADKIAKTPRVSKDQLAQFGQPDRISSIFSYYAVQTPYGFVLPPSKERPSHPNRFLLLRPGHVKALDAATNLASDVRGYTVKAANGDEIGDIDRIMIDPQSGRIAYLLLAHGGFLGLDQKWIPVPAQALTWSAKDNAYTLTVGPTEPKTRHELQKAELPAQVRRDQLRTLYASYGVTPYWQN